MKCIFCETETTNPRFCSRSCAVSFNNSAHPKRERKTARCRCGEPITSYRNTVCDRCNPVGKVKISDGTRISRSDATKQDVLTGDTQRFRRIRENARQVASRCGKLGSCQVCGYSIHVDACHLVAIKDFNDDTRISVINHPSNLVGLCRNHHWELDHGILSPESFLLYPAELQGL